MAATGFAQTNPAAQTLPLSQNFGTTTFTSMPAGFAAWNGLSGAALTSQSLAEASSPTGNATVATATAAQTGGGVWGYAVSSNARPYIQTSSNTSNGANQISMALNCSGWDNVVVGYEVEVISAQSRTVGVVCQYRVGTSGSWTTLTATSGSNPFSQAAGTTGLKTTVSATLPAAANNQPVVQVRWAVWRGTESGNSSGIAIDNVTASGTPTGDSTPPTITTYTPADNATGVSTTTTLVAQFSETVTKNTGNITVNLVSDSSTIQTIAVTDAAVSLVGNTATITLPTPLAGTTEYYVNIASGAFKDLAGNSFAGISNNSTWTFTTAVVDVTGPAITARVPADEATEVFPNGNLTLTYDENVFAGTGSVLIKKSSDDSVVETIAVGGSQVQTSGTTVTINPSVVLDYATSYYVELPAGAFKDVLNNPTLASTGNTDWNFTTRSTPQLLISQYYEGTTATNRYIELKNLTASPLDLTGYRLAAWYDTVGAEAWKSGTATTDRVTTLDGFTIPANGHFLVALTNATTPTYAAANNDLMIDTGAVLFNGNDSIVLYSGTRFTQAEVVDAISVTTAGNEGLDKTFYRLNNATGFDFNAGTTILGFSTTWGDTKTLAEVSSAAETDAWYLSATQAANNLTLAISPTSFSEGAGTGAATGTITRSGPTVDALDVLITVSDESEAVSSAISVTIPAGMASTTFTLDAVNDPYLDGDQEVTVTVAATKCTPDSKVITVLDEATDIAFPVVINEVDADPVGTDTEEFIELYNTSNAAVSLDGIVVVLYNGATDLSYKTIDLSGYTIAAHDYFVIGSATVPNVDVAAFTTDGIQNGADAIALYMGAASLYPNNTPVTTTNGTLVDALVYDTADADDAELIAALNPGKPQVNESLNGTTNPESMSRVPDGGVAFDTTLYAIQAPTPGTTNSPVSGYDSWATVVGGQTADLDYDGDGLDNGTEYFMGTAGNAFTPNPGVVAGAVTWPRASGTSISSFRVEVSTNLTTWDNATVNYAANLNTTNPNQVVFTMPTGLTRLFVRLSVTP